METITQTASGSGARLWVGRIMSAIVILLLIFDSVIHLLVIAPVVESFNELGLPVDLAVGLGIIVLICLTLYVIPRTSILGAILLTGYLGGAVATQMRVHAPLFSTALFPIYVGVLVWGGLYLRDHALRALIPLRRGDGIKP